MKIAHTSDLHIDWNSEEYVELAKIFAEEISLLSPDVLLLGGDIATDKRKWKRIVSEITSTGIPTFIVPGNHCLATSPNMQGVSSDYIHDELLPNLCLEAGAHPLWKEPRIMEDILFAGSYLHYDHSFILPEFDTPMLTKGKRYAGFQWPDAKYLHWPEYMRTEEGWGDFLDDAALCNFLMTQLHHDLNTRLPSGKEPEAKVVVTHTCPFREGLTIKKENSWNAMSAFIGSEPAGRMIVENGANFSVYGHTHVNKSFMIEKTQAVNSAFGLHELGEWGNCEEDARCRIRQTLVLTTIQGK